MCQSSPAASTESGAGVSGTTGHPEGSDPCAPRRRAGGKGWSLPGRSLSSPAKAPLRLERYVGWNLNTGCEVQRKRPGGGGAEGKERASPASSSTINPFRAM